MAVERNIASSPSIKDRFSAVSISRRDLLKGSAKAASGLVAASLLGAGWEYKDKARDMLEGRSVREEFDRYTVDQGFYEVDGARQEELLGDTTSFADIEIREYQSQEQDGLVDVAFSLDEPTFVVVTVEGSRDEKGSLPVVRAEFEGFEYVVPILQTRLENSQTFALKTVNPGDHTLQFRTTDLSTPLEENGMTVSVRTLDKLTPFGQALLDCLPVLGMQKEFALENIYNNDAPYFRNVYFYERSSDGKVRVAFFEGRTAEDGGIGKDPMRMNEELGRLYDFDHSVIPTLGVEDGLVYELAHQKDQLRAHRIVTETTFPFGVDPKSIQERFYYHSVPDHGMVERGLERKRNGELLHNKVYSLYPDLSFHEDPTVKAERSRVRKLIAVREHRREREREMSELADLYQSFLTPENFPEQFATLAFLQEEEERLLSE